MPVRFDFSTRSVGLLMHPTSLPGPAGSGDLGYDAHAFIDFLADAGARWWQMLPVGPAGDPPGNSPYSSWSSAGGSPMLVSLDLLQEDDLLTAADVADRRHRFRDDVVEFDKVAAFRGERLKRAYARFKAKPKRDHAAFREFCKDQKSWLDDFALFITIKQAHGLAGWTQWPKELRDRKPQALTAFAKSHAETLDYHRFVQWCFDNQWQRLHTHATTAGVGLIGDVPIFVAHDSVDVWRGRPFFRLDRFGQPHVVSGYPPDAMSVEGQKWGHPHYTWRKHEETNFSWWVERFREMFRLFDAVRIDHFLGFLRTWAIPADAPTAHAGKWVPSPGAELFTALRRELGEVPIIAEDLGLLTPEAEHLRDSFGFAGMRIMQFGFGDDPYHLPHLYPRRSVAYTGTHDNETIVGWHARVKRESAKAKFQQSRVEYAKATAYVPLMSQSVHVDFIRALMASTADTVIFPVQDVLGLDASHRMNTPGTAEGNWAWRLPPGSLRRPVSKMLKTVGKLYGRV